MSVFRLGEDELTTDKLVELSAEPFSGKVIISDAAMGRANSFRAIIDNALQTGKVHYGINTGFGFLSNVTIPDDKLKQLQVNIIRSHACGVGKPLAPEMVRALLVLRLHTFLIGYTGISVDTIKTLFEFLKKDVLPIIPCQGSVGASGDLAPLSHLALGLMGEGSVLYKGELLPARQVCERLDIKPLDPKPKEGLSLINGTHFMSVLAAFAVERARIVGISADIIAALSLEAIRGTDKPFNERIHNVRKHQGQRVVAENIRKIFNTHSNIMDSHKDCNKVQDPYSFRCIPQVHGASRDVFWFTRDRINIELNSVTDNPLCFEDGQIISGGNFHGQPIALAMDMLAIAVAEYGSISERRIEKLTNPAMSGLPAFITENGGMNSGYMIPHVVAAALASENKVLCHPASVDSIPTSADKEDHVSMGPIAARKALEVIENVSRILAVELLAACQGIDLLKPLKLNRVLESVYGCVRQISPSMTEDRSLHGDIEDVKKWIMDSNALNIAIGQGVTLE
jgi:histidine ammonia-lyase